MNDNFNDDNEIIEISNDYNSIEKKEDTNVEFIENEPREKIVKEKKNRPKVKKSVIIAIIVVVVIVIAFLLVYFLVLKKEKKPEPVKVPDVIVEKDNYRYENGKLIFLDKSDKEVGKYECNFKDADKCLTTKIDYSNDTFERIKIVDASGIEIPKSSQVYLNRFVFITDGDKSFLYDLVDKKELLKVNKIKTYSTSRNLVVIEDEDNKYGLIEIKDEEFEYLIRPSYNNLGIINPTLLYLVADDKEDHYIIDVNGKKLSKTINADIKSVNDKYIVAVKGSSYNLYDYDFYENLSDYDYISLHDNLIALVSNNRLYLVDYEFNKLFEDGYRLLNKNYVKEYTMDADNNLKENEKSYNITIRDGMALIDIGNDQKQVNISEGIISSKLDYVSYFDGKLYFYSDKEKTDLVGTYACNNKNTINNSESKLNNCHIYEDNGNYSGIYNNTYVFLYDNGLSTNNIYLYSLKEKKVKGTYSKIAFMNAEELNESIKQIYTGSSFVVALAAVGSNKDNYGVLEITSDGVSGKVPFSYKSYEAKNNYYILKDTALNSTLFNKNFTTISNPLNYIELYDNYYAGIVNNKLNIYSYINKSGILEEEVTVPDNNFKVDFTDGIKITVNDTVYSYTKDGKKVVPKEDEIISPDNNTNNNEDNSSGDNNEE